MNIECNKVFEFSLENIQFAYLSREEVFNILSDGRVSSHFLEKLLEKWFPELVHVDKKGYDHIDSFNFKYDQKCFTFNGLKFMPSNQIGQGRKFDIEKSHIHAQEITYICCSVYDLPTVRVIFKKGRDLVRDFPQCQIKFNDRSYLFNN